MSFNPTKDIPDLAGKVILVTGGNAGIGRATIRALAPHNPASIYLCARRRSAGDATAAELRAETKYENIHVLDLDLASLESVKKCAAEFNARAKRLDILFLNAGVGNTAHALTKEGYELQFGVNHVGHALLTQLLMPTMLRTAQENPKADVRLIATSSDAAFAPFLPKSGLELGAMRKPDAYSPMTLYAHSKLANVHFIRKISQLYPDITATAAHPGVVKTEIWEKSAGGLIDILFKPILYFTGVSEDQGAKSQLWCATASRGARGVANGAFYQPVGKLKTPKGAGADQKLTDELWEWTNARLAEHSGGAWP